MLVFSPRFTLIFMLAANGCLIAAGFSMFAYGIYMKSSSSNSITDDSDSNQSDGTTNIVTGCFDIVVGVCGIIGTLMKKRLLLMGNVVILGLAILTNLIILIVTGVSTSSQAATVKVDFRNAIIEQYGDNSQKESRDFTNEIDKYHSDEPCCGWSGLDGENLFLKSPWYKQINVNEPGDPRTLPDSCCTGNTNDECSRAKDVKVARDKGVVYKHDCVDRMIRRFMYYMWISMIQMIFAILLQGTVVAISVLTLLQGNAMQG